MHVGLVVCLLLWPASGRGAEPAVTAKVVTAAELQAAIARHKGKVVLVDGWATWCIPCLKDFPKTVALSRKFADRGLVVMSLSFDDLVDGQPPPKVLKFLEKQQATFENFVSAVDLSDDGAEAFHIEGGALPNLKLYGRDGKLLKVFTAGDDDAVFSHEDVVQAVEAALMQK
jgi:thiol-disulfide isomerase/thioredoxin